MQFELTREILLKLLRAVAGVVERKVQSATPILGQIILRFLDTRLEVTATDREIELVASADLPMPVGHGEFILSFRKLNDIFRALPEGALVTFRAQEGKVLITSGRSRFSLATINQEAYPVIDNFVPKATFSLPQTSLQQILDRTAFSMAEQDVRYYLNGMLVECKRGVLNFVAADGHRMAINALRLSSLGAEEDFRIIVPRKAILEISRLLDGSETQVTITVGEHHLKISTHDLILTTRLLDGKFPDYKQVVPQGGDKVLRGSREAFKEAFMRAGALLTDRFRGVKLRLCEDRLQVLAKTKEHDEVEEDLEVHYDGPPLEIGFNVRYLLDLLAVVQDTEVQFKFSDSTQSALMRLMTDELESTFILMPMRL